MRAALLTLAAASLAGFLLLAAMLLLLGYSPVAAFVALWNGAFGSWYAFTSTTLVRSTPLIILGLGFALAFRGGALNIGMEGQFLAGAIAATWAGLHLTGWPAVAAIPVVLAAGFAAGAAWVAIPVLLKLRFGVLEVISTLLLNFVAEALVSLMVQGPLQEAKGVYPQSDLIAGSARLAILPGTRLHTGFFLAVLLAATGQLLFDRTLWGFRLKAAGAGPRAAWMTGRINAGRMMAVALLVSGALAGLGGSVEVTGVTYALFQNLSPGFGFTAIAVALLARGQPLGIVATGVLFGALDAGAGAMQREAGIPSVAVFVVQAVIIVVVLLAEVMARRRRALRVYPDAAEVPA
ncbi:MAG: ABC-type transporter, integral rane subunit [Gemmatimonadetes bacterium]|nr:ABC-type transporter, integral rane subunit [Gemmatimonadota bacterium]